MMTLLVLWPGRYALRVLEVIAIDQAHQHHLHPICGQEPAGTNMYAIAERHHLVVDRGNLRAGEIASLTHT